MKQDAHTRLEKKIYFDHEAYKRGKIQELKIKTISKIILRVKITNKNSGIEKIKRLKKKYVYRYRQPS